MATTLARKFRVDVTSDLTLASGFLQVNGISDFQPNITPALQDTSAYDTTGWNTKEVTMNDWNATATFFRRVVGGVYDPGQELIRASLGQFGTAARVGIRWYDRNGGPEAYSGVTIASWKRGASATSNVESASVTFEGTDIPLNLNITNPAAGAVVPTITSATPSAQSVGKILTIVGANFTGTTAITIGGVAVSAGNYIVQSDAMITAVMPAGTAGSAPIIVTNVAGPSASFAYTRGA
jgi:hypothetical protein